MSHFHPQSSCCRQRSTCLRRCLAVRFLRHLGTHSRHPRRAHEPPTSPCGSDPEPTSHLASTDATVPTAARATHPCAAHAAILRHARSDAAPRPHIENAALCCPCTTPHTLVFAAFRRPAPTQLRVSPPTPLCSAEQQLATKLSRSVPILNPSPRLTSSVPHYPPLAYLSPAYLEICSNPNPNPNPNPDPPFGCADVQEARPRRNEPSDQAQALDRHRLHGGQARRQPRHEWPCSCWLGLGSGSGSGLGLGLGLGLGSHLAPELAVGHDVDAAAAVQG